MRLHYYKDPRGNFGDDLNPWLWSRLIPDLIDDDARTLFLGIGTILRSNLPRRSGKVVFGSGVGYGEPPSLDERWRVYGVRGPRTAAALGLDPEAALTDPAVLVRLFMEPARRTERSGIAFVPHHETVWRADAQDIQLGAIARENDMIFVDPRSPVDRVIDQIRRARFVVAEAMHGAILADAFRVPWRPVRLYSHVLALKWHDWMGSLGIPYEPIVLDADRPTASDFGDFLGRAIRMNATEWMLSETAVLNRLIARLTHTLGRLQNDHVARQLVVGEVDHPSRPAPALPAPSASWWHAIAATLKEITSAVPSDQTIALADDGQWSIDDGTLAQRIVRLPALTTMYAGPPDHDAAGEMLEAARARGIRHVAVGWPSFWWLDTYERFRAGLDANWRCVHESVWCRVFEAST
jgi:Polysaccharide pyruvyl transferase